MRILGIDYGRRRLGLALSDEDGVLASPLPHLRRGHSIDRDLRDLASLASSHGVGAIVVGLPLHMDGSEGEMAEEATRFARALEQAVGVPVELLDERLTSEEAERVLLEADLSRRKRKELRDGLAAVLILQCHLDRRRTERR